MIPHGILIIATHRMLLTDQKLIPLFFWPAQRPKCFKKCELFQDIPNLAELPFVRYALQSKVPMSATTSRYYFKIAIPFLLTKMILVTFQAKMLHAFGHATLFSHASDTICSKDKNHYAFVMPLRFPMLLTQYAPKTRMKSLTTHFPRFGAKNEIYYSLLLFIYHYSLSLFTVTIHFEFLPI